MISASSRGERRYDRESAEFNRVLAFSDGLFAIAMTLLVVSIAVPKISDGDSISDLADALNDLSPAFISFFISFAVIGRYWLAHHTSISLLEAMDQPYISLNLLYLASLSPVVFFALSIPFAFLSTTLAVAIWFLAIPFGIFAERRAPKGADQLLAG